MLHHSNFILIFFAIFLAFFFVITVRTTGATYSTKENTEYTSKLTAASHSAVQTIEPKKLINGEYLWNDEESRKKAVDAFYYSLASSFMQTTMDRSLQVSTPILLLIDTDGYYIGYNALFDWNNIAGVTTTDYKKIDDFNQSIQMTSLGAWGEERFGYHIRYYLDDNYVSIIAPSGKKYTGRRGEVAAWMEKDGVSATEDIIHYIKGEFTAHTATGDNLGDAFLVYKEDIIVNSIEDALSRYINQYNYSAGNNGGGYSLTMPDISGEMWHRLLVNPTFVAFLQGDNINNGEKIINTYAYSGGELLKGDKYFITEHGGKKIYHSYRECVKNGEILDTDTEFFTGHSTGISGGQIEKLYFTMGDCAAQGAVPCPDCIK